MADNFRESGPGWLGQKLLRRSWEAVEYWFGQQDFPELPQWEPPDWLVGFLNFLGELGVALAQQWPILLTLFLLVVLVFLGRWLYGRYGDRPLSAYGDELLPEEASLIPGSVDSWLTQAQEYHLAKRYGEACRALYFAMLLKWDEAEIIPQRPSRTDREYIYLVQDLPQSDASQLLLETHERLCFSRAAADDELFQHCLRSYQQIEQQVQALLQARNAQVARGAQ